MKITKYTSALAVCIALFACSASAGMPAIDYYGHTLPGDLILNKSDSGTPTSVSSGQTSLALYAYGTAPPPTNAYAAIKRECNKILPNQTSCYSTNPFETNIVEDSICGYDAVPAAIVACTANTCVTEIYTQSCDSAIPKVGGSSMYSVGVSSKNFAGSLGDITEIGQQDFHSKMDFTGNLNTAVLIKQQGRIPVIGIGAMLFNFNGTVKPNAAAILDKAIAKYPTLFVPGLLVELVDEPFMRATPESVQTQINGINAMSALLRSRIPGISIGITVAPTWDYEPQIIPATEAIIQSVDWLTTDCYQITLGDMHAVDLANQFSTYMKANHPTLPIFLIVQGFAPINSKKPVDWGQSEINSYLNFMNTMGEAAKSYSGVLIWGWNAVFELDDAYAGKNFPQVIKDAYRAATQ